MSRRTIRAFARSLTFAPVALVVHIGAATAGGSVDDLLEQQRALLSGRATAISAPTSAQRSTGEVKFTGDAQEQARRVLLAVPTRNLSPQQPRVSRASADRVYGDAQAQARHVLRGRDDAPSAGS
jgi:hypothetical protein